MIRRIDYRLAANVFIFCALWFVIGAILLWSSLPGKLGIGGEMFGVWLVLFFIALATAGSLLTIASLNTLFPPRSQSPPAARKPAPRPASSSLWAPTTPNTPSTSANPRRDG
jgi:hypothetical protein